MILKGISIVNKRIRARAFVIDVPNAPGAEKIIDIKLPKGDFILVCESTYPAILPFMLKAKGIVCEVGGLLNHTSIVAREFNIPTIINVKGAMDKIKTGDILTLKENKVEIRSKKDA